MATAFDEAISTIALAKYHNHRLETHSDTVSERLFADLVLRCGAFAADVRTGVVKKWTNVRAPGDRLRKVDLFVGEPDVSGGVDITRVRLALENKSVVTAHRNRGNRFDDLRKVLGAIHSERPEALLVATVLIGLASRVLNIPDRVRPLFLGRDQEFRERVLPRLSTGDATLWTEFPGAVSRNTRNDPVHTVNLLRSIPVRKPGLTHLQAYDALMLVPVHIDNVSPPEIPRPNSLGIDVDAEYDEMLASLCAAYTARWHM
jgi:hypothetical protein